LCIHLYQNTLRSSRKLTSPLRTARQRFAISPTRELASQIAAEAKQLPTFHQDIKILTVLTLA
jgi:superfamily II DNA/RNA helicase